MKRFTKVKDGWKDTKTGLVWGKTALNAMIWQEAVDYYESLGKWWRLPTIEELITLIDFNKYNPVTELQGMISSYYWSATTYAGYAGNAWYVNFGHGHVDYGSKTNGFYVRPVRGRQ